jgi:hypothetical protein
VREETNSFLVTVKRSLDPSKESKTVFHHRNSEPVLEPAERHLFIPLSEMRYIYRNQLASTERSQMNNQWHYSAPFFNGRRVNWKEGKKQTITTKASVEFTISLESLFEMDDSLSVVLNTK